MFHRLAQSIVELLQAQGISPFLFFLLLLVFAGPFMLRPLRNWKTASLFDKYYVVIYFIALAGGVIGYILYLVNKAQLTR